MHLVSLCVDVVVGSTSRQCVFAFQRIDFPRYVLCNDTLLLQLLLLLLLRSCALSFRTLVLALEIIIASA